MIVTKATLAALLEVDAQGGEVTCGSFARGRYGNNRGQLSGGRTLSRIAKDGYLRSWLELFGSYQIVWYGLTQKGREVVAAYKVADRTEDVQGGGA